MADGAVQGSLESLCLVYQTTKEKREQERARETAELGATLDELHQMTAGEDSARQIEVALGFFRRCVYSIQINN